MLAPLYDKNYFKSLFFLLHHFNRSFIIFNFFFLFTKVHNFIYSNAFANSLRNDSGKTNGFIQNDESYLMNVVNDCHRSIKAFCKLAFLNEIGIFWNWILKYVYKNAFLYYA